MIWAGMVRNTTKKQYIAFASDTRILGLNDSAYIKALNPVRLKAGMPQLPLVTPVNFTGEWVLNEEKSTLNDGGTANLANKLTILHNGDVFALRRLYVDEWSAPRITEEKLKLNGEEIKTEGEGRSTIARLTAQSDTISINAKINMRFGIQTVLITTSESWHLQNKGKELCVRQRTTSPRGERKITLIYDRIGR